MAQSDPSGSRGRSGRLLQPGLRAQIIGNTHPKTGSSSGGEAGSSRKRPAETSSEHLHSEHASGASRPMPEAGWVEALDYPEHHLEHQEAQTLKAQREEQRHELHRHSDSGFPERCFAMAEDNVLARRNHTGRALIFLQSANDAATNSYWLTRYLVKLAAPHAPPHQPYQFHQCVMECAELAARYFVLHPDWFKGEPLHQYASIASHLGKYPDSEIAMRALACIADEALHVRDIGSLDIRSRTQLVGSFAKNAGSGRCRDAALRIIADSLQDRRCVLGSRDTLMFINALGKWPEHPRAEAAACMLAERIADPHLRLKQKMQAADVTGMLNVFSQWPTRGVIKHQAIVLGNAITEDRDLRQNLGCKEVSRALLALSQWAGEGWARQATLALAAEMRLNRSLLDEMSAESLCDGLNALGKWPAEPVMSEFVSLLAGKVFKDGGLRREMDAQGVSVTLNAFGKWPTAPKVRESVLALADRLAGDAFLRLELDAYSMSVTLNALSKWPTATRVTEAVLALAARLVSDEALRRQMSAQNLGSTLSALSKWPQQRQISEAAMVLAGRLAGDEGLRRQMKPQVVGGALNALSKWPTAPQATDAALALAGRLARDNMMQRQMNDQHVSNSLNALSKWPAAPQAEDAALALAGRLARDGMLRRKMNAQHVSTSLNALSKWPEAAQALEAALALAGRLVRDGALRRQLSAQQVSNSLNALSKWPEVPQAEDAALAVAARLARDETLRRQMNAQQVSTSLNALSKWPTAAPVTEAALVLAGRLVRDEALQRQMNAHDVSASLNALSKWPAAAQALDAALALAGRLAGDEALRRQMSAQHVSNSLNALSKWPEAAQALDAAQALAARLVRDGALRRQMSAQDVSNSLNALSKWPEVPQAEDAALAAAGRLARDGALRRQMTAQHVSNSLNALSKWPAAPQAEDAALALAGRLARDEALRRQMSAQHVSNSLNALSKWPAAPQAADAALALAGRLVSDGTLRRQLSAQQVSNSLTALSKWPEAAQALDAALALAERLVRDEALRRQLNAQEVSSTLNALSKWPEVPQAEDAALVLAARLAGDGTLRRQLNAQQVSNSLNALSKWPAAAQAADAALGLAEQLAGDEALQRQLNAQHMSNSLNALSKWPEAAQALEAALALAARLAGDEVLRRQMNAHDVSNSLNALSKWPAAPQALDAALALAARLAGDEALRRQMNAQGVSNSLNALSKWPEKQQALDAALALAARLNSDEALQRQMNVQEVSATLNALSKWPKTPQARNAGLALAERLVGDSALRERMDALNMSNSLNALSKWSEVPQAEDAARVLAEMLARDGMLRRQMNAQEVSATLNALSKWPASAQALDAVSALAERLVSDEVLRQQLSAQHVSNSLNALSKWPASRQARDAALGLAERLGLDDALCRQLSAQELSLALNALSKWPLEPQARETAWLLAAPLGTHARAWGRFALSDMSQIANAMHTISRNDEQEAAECRTLLEGLSVYLELHPERFGDAGARAIGVLFKAYESLHMPRALRPLARPALARVETLLQENRMRDEPLESVAALCMGLLPLARSSDLLRYRPQALKTLEALQPVVARKIEGYLRREGTLPSGNALHLRDDGEACGTRRPALSFYQVLKAYSLVARQWKIPHVDGERNATKARQEALTRWVQEMTARTQRTIQADLQEMSWNLIAQIEAGDGLYDALDLRLNRETAAIVARHPPITFELAQLRHQLRSPPGRPGALAPGTGATRHIIVDTLGRQVKTDDDETQRPYSFYARLTGQPLVEVELPGEFSAFVLARTFQFQGEPWRFDMFGGSRLNKGAQNKVKDILDGNTSQKSLLPAVRYADTVPGSDFMRLVEKLSPQREDWSRIQRALLEMVPPDHVVEGTLRLGWCADVPGPQHPFRLTGPSGERVALCPNDGCGFLKWTVARQIPAVREMMMAWEASRAGQATASQHTLLKSQVVGQNSIPSQALMHYPRSQAVQEEAHDAMQHRVAEWQANNEHFDLLTLYQMIVSGGYQGRRVRAVPSADERLYLPTITLPGFQRPESDVLLGKPPYDNENLQPIAVSRVVTPADGDSTARFLDQCFSIQYSYTGFDEDSGEDADMLHSKGMLIIPPPGYWSPAHAGQDMVCSREDLKILSRWKSRRERDTLPAQMLCTGSLRVKEILAPGRLGAVPIPELRKRSMDTDGDEAFVYAGYPALAAHIREVMAARGRRRGAVVSFKPPKTATAAFDEQGRYHTGRAREIMNQQLGGKLLGKASIAARRFLAQPDALREKMARGMMFGVYDGVERSLRNGLRRWLADGRDAPALNDLRGQARAAIDRAHLPEAREAAALLHHLTLRLGEGDEERPPAMSDALAQAMPGLAMAYAQATDAPSRIHAVLDNYPVCRLSHEQFPHGQPGLVPGEPELTIRNLFTLAVKVGTDALKSDTGVGLFSKIIDRCEMTERNYAERIRKVPYGKQTAYEVRNGRFNPEQAKTTLASIPTLAAAVMEDAVETLQKAGLLSAPPTAQEQAQTLSPKTLRNTALALNGQARQAQRRITHTLQRLLPGGAYLAGLEHSVKSVSSLEDKLTDQFARHRQDWEQAVAHINDALRYSVVLPHHAFVEAYRQVVVALEDEGHELLQRKNYFARWNMPFRSINVSLREAESGQRWEIQFHTGETFPLKARYHDVYKDQQRLSRQGQTSETVKARMNEALQAFRRVPVPAGCEEIDDWQATTAPARVPRPAPEPAGASSTAGQVEAILTQARQLEHEVTPRLVQALQAHGGQLRRDEQGDWRAFIFKKPASIARKLALIQASGSQGATSTALSVRDALRYEIILPAEKFADRAQAILNLLERERFEAMRLRNGFVEPDTTYAGVNVKLRSTGASSGDRYFEVQFHTRDSLKAKLKSHKDYESLRKLPGDRAADHSDEAWADIQDKRAYLLEKIQGMAACVSLPEHIHRLRAFEHER
ncbi:XopAD/skwp family type III secretion system effector [Brenneria rubrifaciens]|uniref:XopAD/skwp family type III secretion system effector n=1 Tax=Brenneria rubrifaciens TaxID=55213 RepID=UPI001586F22F|nr:XopAD/skwp family type III secretion system effector [Brenneria rubrifaciens]